MSLPLGLSCILWLTLCTVPRKASNVPLGVPSPLASGSGLAAAASSLLATMPVNPSPPSTATEDPGYDALAEANAENPDWTYDPNEPRYCVCNQVSYGDMVACDNEDVSTCLNRGVVGQGTSIRRYKISNFLYLYSYFQKAMNFYCNPKHKANCFVYCNTVVAHKQNFMIFNEAQGKVFCGQGLSTIL